jgi:ABC-type bacteriocin/lantibiotic exporter with double-glycine peptidase domain
MLQQNNDIFYNTQFAHVFDTDFMSNVTIFDSFPETPTIEELLSRLSLGKENLMNAKTISGGQKQMITFIRAMNSPYNVLLMDEPCSSVDVKHADILLQYALESDKTIIMTSHTQLPEQDFTQVISL